jgi:hypothetical protein
MAGQDESQDTVLVGVVDQEKSNTTAELATAELTTAPTTTSTKTNSEYPTGLRLALVLSSVYISLFLVSLDRLIVTTAIPAITNEFNSLPDVGC